MSRARGSGPRGGAGGGGVQPWGPTEAQTVVISGNTIHDVPGSGIVASGRALVEGNTVERVSAWGLSGSGGAEARDNVVHDNTNGVYLSGATLTGNRIYHNTGTGVHVDTSGLVTGN